QDDQRAGAADQRLGEDARAFRGALRVEEGVATGQVELDVRRQRGADRVSNLSRVRVGAEPRLTGRVDRREGAVAVFGDVGAAPRRVVRADSKLRELRRRLKLLQR